MHQCLHAVQALRIQSNIVREEWRDHPAKDEKLRVLAKKQIKNIISLTTVLLEPSLERTSHLKRQQNT